MSGFELKQIADAEDLKPVDVCSEAKVSINTLYKVYNGTHVRPKSKDRVEQAIKRLSAKMKQAVAG